MKLALRFEWLALILVIVAVGVVRYLTPLAPCKMSNATMAILRSATAVKAYTIDSNDPSIDLASFKKSVEQRIEGRLVTDGGHLQSAEYLHKLQNILLKYGPTQPDDVTCFNPAYLFQVESPKGVVNILVCFECNGLLVVGHDTHGAVTSSTYCMLGRRAQFAELVKVAFPNDPKSNSI